MHFAVTLDLNRLRCIQPDDKDGGVDEPYLWSFFFNFDGQTIRPSTINALQLAASVAVTAGPGGHGNLGISEIHPGQIVNIPDAVGRYTTTLRPLRFQGPGMNVVAPGRLVAAVTLMEEDATQDSAIVTAHGQVRALIENGWNDLLNGQNLLAIRAQANANFPGIVDEQQRLMAEIQRQIDQFSDQLSDQASDLVEDVVIEDSNIFELLVNLIDSDESAGAVRFMFDEQQIIAGGLSLPVYDRIIRRVDGVWETFYEIWGQVEAKLTPTPDDFEEALRPVDAGTQLASGNHRFQGNQICIPAGTTITWTIQGRHYEQEYVFRYPFLPVEWSIEGQILNAPQGTIKFQSSCVFPAFDATKPGLTRHDTVQKQVEVSYTIEDRGPAGRALRLRNRIEDGGFPCVVKAVGLAGNGVRIDLETWMVFFPEHALTLGPPEFAAAYEECLERIANVGKLGESKRVTPKDLWGPFDRFERYMDLIRQADALQSIGVLTPSQVRKVSARAAKILRTAPL